jgi:hypothetical protein
MKKSTCYAIKFADGKFYTGRTTSPNLPTYDRSADVKDAFIYSVKAGADREALFQNKWQGPVTVVELDLFSKLPTQNN